MNASNIGSKDWWRVVQSMPPDEALMHLNDYRASLMIYNAGHPQYITAAAQIAKINAEIKRFNRVIDNGRWYRACKNVLDQEAFDAVIMEKRRLEDEAKGVFA
jgi:hypothetical protein